MVLNFVDLCQSGIFWEFLKFAVLFPLQSTAGVADSFLIDLTGWAHWRSLTTPGTFSASTLPLLAAWVGGESPLDEGRI